MTNHSASVLLEQGESCEKYKKKTRKGSTVMIDEEEKEEEEEEEEMEENEDEEEDEKDTGRTENKRRRRNEEGQKNINDKTRQLYKKVRLLSELNPVKHSGETKVLEDFTATLGEREK